MLAHKTYTPDFKTHKSVKNEGKLPKYRKRDHHEAIVSREVYHAAQLIRASSYYKRKKHALPVMSVIEDGILRGYVSIDRNWEGFSPEDYQMACENYSSHIDTEESEEKQLHISGQKLNLRGYQRVSGHFFPSSDDLFLTISGGRINVAMLTGGKKPMEIEDGQLSLDNAAAGDDPPSTLAAILPDQFSVK